MKTIKILLIVFALLMTGMGMGQTLTFRVTNPVIMHTGGSPGYDMFQFDLEVKCNVGTTYLWAGQAQFSFNNTTFLTASANWTYVKGTLLNGNNSLDNPRYSMGKSIVTVGSLKEFYISWMGDASAFPNGLDNGTGDWNLVPTSWTQLCQVRGRITDATGLAGIDMTETVFNGNQQYVNGYSSAGFYTIPNLFDTREFSTAYVNRVYCGTNGWSQCGTSTAASPTQASPVWTSSVNTSVWDTSAAAATIDNASSKAAALRIHSGARLKISAGKDLTCTGATEINEPRGLVIEANATGMGQFLDNGTITYPGTGSARAECYFTQSKWHYLCIPVASTRVSPFENLYVKYYRETTHGWKFLRSMDSLLNTSMLGYALWSSSSNPPMGNATVKLTGSLNTGSLSIPITRTLISGTDYDGYNQVGNPYVSAIDLSSAGVSWTEVDQKAWFYNSGSYTVYIKAGGGTRASSYAAPQQGFFVHHTEANTTEGSLAFNNTVRTINPEAFIKSTEELADYLLLTAERPGTEYKDLAAVYFREDATCGYDDVYDAGKMWGSPEAPQLYSNIPDHKLTVNALNWSGNAQVVPLAFQCSVGGDFRISASELGSFREGTLISLEDLKEGKTQSLMQNPVYSFSYLAGENADRFLLHFSNPFFGNDEKKNENLRIYSYGDAVYVKQLMPGNSHGTITLYNPCGMKVFEGMLEDIPLNSFHPGVVEGCYVARVRTQSTVLSEKIFLKQN